MDALPLLALRWAAFYSLALLLGAEAWKIFYLRPSVSLRPVPGAVEYGEAMLQLFVRWQRVLAPVALVAAGGNLAAYAVNRPEALPWAIAGGLSLAVGLAGIVLSWGRAPDARQQDLPSWFALAGLAVAMAATAGVDVTLQAGHSWPLILNRALHLWAFAVWLGGALWNIFIAVPAGLARVNMDTVILANFQLERFRVVVRAVFPTIIVTGLVQAWAMFGWNWQALTSNLWGYLVLTKVGLIVALIGVFLACPMWKACSPIRGVCDLDDL